MNEMNLRIYLYLEHFMLKLDDGPLADDLRYELDDLWYRLTDEQHEMLDRREGPRYERERKREPDARMAGARHNHSAEEGDRTGGGKVPGDTDSSLHGDD